MITLRGVTRRGKPKVLRTHRLASPENFLTPVGETSVKKPSPQSAVGMAKKEELTMDNQDVIATLNDLLESRDGEQGFHTCAEVVESPNLKGLFDAAARRCAEGAAELEAKVRSLGGEPAEGGSISGSMHRAWTNIKSTSLRRPDQAAGRESGSGR